MQVHKKQQSKLLQVPHGIDRYLVVCSDSGKFSLAHLVDIWSMKINSYIVIMIIVIKNRPVNGHQNHIIKINRRQRLIFIQKKESRTLQLIQQYQDCLNQGFSNSEGMGATRVTTQLSSKKKKKRHFLLETMRCSNYKMGMSLQVLRIV